VASQHSYTTSGREVPWCGAGLPPGVQRLLGLGGQTTLTSPVGYLNSQFFANLLPVMLLVFAVGMAAWAISGDEAAGTLELLLANPVSRARVAAERAGALLLLATLTAVCAAALLATAPAVGLDKGLPAGRLLAASVACALLALVYAAVAFAVGAATGSRRSRWRPPRPPPSPASSSRAWPSRSPPCASPGGQPLALAPGQQPAPGRPGAPGCCPWPWPPSWSFLGIIRFQRRDLR
jgi:hypothetical protein